MEQLNSRRAFPRVPQLVDLILPDFDLESDGQNQAALTGANFDVNFHFAL